MTNREHTFKKENVDPGFLVAKGRFSGEGEEKHIQEKSHRSKLANAVFHAVLNNGYATIRAIGTNAIANAVRAITMASIRCKKSNINIYWDSTFDKGNLGPMRAENHVKDVTAIVFSLKKWEEEEPENV